MGDRRWVLVTDGRAQSRPSLAAVRALAAAGYRPAVTVSMPHTLAGASRFCARRVPVPRVLTDGYAEAVRAEVTRRPYLTILPTSDSALLALAAPVEHLVDKAALATLAEAAGLRLPPTEVFDDGDAVLAAADRLDLPALVKPAIGKPTVIVRSPDELAYWAGRPGPLLVQPYLTERIHSISGVIWKGTLAAAVHQRYLRLWPPEAGMSSAAETVEPDIPCEEALVRLLADYEGVFQAQFAGPYLLDLNPRVYGSFPLAVKAGANLVGIYCDLLRGLDPPFVRARSNVFYRWLDGDLRNVRWGVRNGRMSLLEAARALRPRPGAAHSVESLTDPGPMLARLMARLKGGASYIDAADTADPSWADP
jgi:ATP-grasp domain-containing protein